MEANVKINSVRLLMRKAEELYNIATEIGIETGYIQDIVNNNINVEPSFIVELVENKLSVSIIQKTRARQIVDARRIVCYLLRKYSGLSLKRIALYVNLKDHSSIIHHIETIKGFLGHDDALQSLVSWFEDKIIEQYEKRRNERNNF
jgi:chromosomal replication initiator protein